MTKYEEKIKPRFEEIKEWARAGATHKEIAAALYVGYSTFTLYLTQHEELRDLMSEAQKSGVPDVKAALLKRALGFKYIETKTSTRMEEDGKTVEYTETTEKYCPPDVSAIAMYLRNNSDDWKDKDAKFYEYKEQELKLREKQIESQEYR